jgi:hypothetical protein
MTPGEVPPELKKILDERAGKAHSDGGPVMSALAEILTRHREMVCAEGERYRNALVWVRHVAGLHYMGGAFDPEHMRDLANMATAALQGNDLPDYGETMARGRQKAEEYAALFASWADGADDDGEEAGDT